MNREIIEKELRIELLNKGFSSSETDFLIQKTKEEYFEKGFGKDLQSKHSNSQWKTINGAKVLVGSNGEVIVGADGALSGDKKTSGKKELGLNVNRLFEEFTKIKVENIRPNLKKVIDKTFLDIMNDSNIEKNKIRLGNLKGLVETAKRESSKESDTPKLSNAEKSFFDSAKGKLGISDEKLSSIVGAADMAAKLDGKKKRDLGDFAEGLQYHTKATVESLKDADTYIKNSPYDPEDTGFNYLDKLLSNGNGGIARMQKLGIHEDKVNKILPDLKEIANFTKDVKGKGDTFAEITISKKFKEGGVKAVKEFKEMYNKVPNNVDKNMVSYYAHHADKIKDGDYSSLEISKVPRAKAKRKEIAEGINNAVKNFKKMGVKVPQSIVDKEIKKLKL